MAGHELNREELLKDSEATLREVAGILLEVWDGKLKKEGVEIPELGNGEGEEVDRNVLDLVAVLLKTYEEIQGILRGIKTGRGILQRAAMERVQKTHHKLEEVTMTTEMAATDMLDGLDKALGLVDAMEPSAEASDDEKKEAGDELREELNRLVILLQFQDITAQQLAHAAGVLTEVEQRLEGLSKLFDLHHLDSEEELLKLVDSAETESVGTFDPSATTDGAESRQALADEVFVSQPPKGNGT